MQIKDQIRGIVSGRIAVGPYYEDRDLFLPKSVQPNQIQYTWAVSATRQMGYKRQAGRADYSIAGMYIEFENVADPLDAVAVPSVDRNEGIEYYEDLMGSSARDFVRAALRMEPALSVAPGYEGLYPDGEGNMLTFFAATTGTTGVHGKTFSSGVNSKICGFALVAMPVPGDRTQDVIIARTYLQLADQQVKEAAANAGVTWELIFG